MTVEQTAKAGIDGKFHDEWTVHCYEDYAKSFKIKPHKVRIQVEFENDGQIWLGTGENPMGSRLSPDEIDELVTVLLYTKKLIEGGSEDGN